MAFIQKYVPSTKLVEDKGQEVIFKLPELDGYEGMFQELFYALDKYQTQLGVSSYGVSDTSLEEVCAIHISVFYITSI